jgi:hypothetical protein
MRRTISIRLQLRAGSILVGAQRPVHARYIDLAEHSRGKWVVLMSLPQGTTHREQEGPQSYPPDCLVAAGPALASESPSRDGQVERERVNLVVIAWLQFPRLKHRKCRSRRCLHLIASRPSPASHYLIPRSSRLIAAGISQSKSQAKTGPSASDGAESRAHPKPITCSMLASMIGTALRRVVA